MIVSFGRSMNFYALSTGFLFHYYSWTMHMPNECNQPLSIWNCLSLIFAWNTRPQHIHETIYWIFISNIYTVSVPLSLSSYASIACVYFTVCSVTNQRTGSIFLLFNSIVTTEYLNPFVYCMKKDMYAIYIVYYT